MSHEKCPRVSCNITQYAKPVKNISTDDATERASHTDTDNVLKHDQTDQHSIKRRNSLTITTTTPHSLYNILLWLSGGFTEKLYTKMQEYQKETTAVYLQLSCLLFLCITCFYWYITAYLPESHCRKGQWTLEIYSFLVSVLSFPVLRQCKHL